jgi:hypothetical protein
MVGPTRDVYEVLGIDPSASAALAREFYWRRAGAFLEADRSGDPAARTAIEELNGALAIVMDPTLRAEYDAHHRAGEAREPAGTSTDSIRETVERRSYRRSVLVVGLVPSLAIVIWATFAQGSPLLGVIVTAVGLGLFVVGARWATSETVNGESPFRILRVRDGASADELDAAYESQVHEILLRVHDDPLVLRRLELLDEAYLCASTIIAEGDSGRTGRRLRGVDWVGCQAERAGRGFLNLVHRVLRAVLRATAAAASAVGRRLSSAVAHTVRRVRSRPVPGAVPIETAQVERRLAAAFRGVSERVANSPVAPASDAGARTPPRPQAYLVLRSSGGDRRIPIGSSPVRIGAAATCDLVLKEPGVAMEHALIWQRGDLVLIHGTDQYASCLINERPMSWATLDDGDEIRLGEATLHVEVKS